MAMDKIRVGLIGISVESEKSWSARAHVPALRHLPAYELIALSTSRAETARAAARHFGVPLAFDDGICLAEHADVDMVVVSVRAPHHYVLVKAAIAAGKHVFCEWPLGGTAELAKAMRHAAMAAGVQTMIGLQAYGHETLRYVRDLIADGYIGQVVSTNWHCWQELFGPRQQSMFAQLADASQNMDLLRIATGHTLSAMDCCLGRFSELSAIMATQYDSVYLEDTGEHIPKTAPDQILISGILESGAVASVHLMGGATRTAGTRIEISGTAGDILLTSQGAANVNRADFELRAGRGNSMEIMQVPKRYRLQPSALDNGPPLALAHLYADFADLLAGKSVSVPDFSVGVRVHEAVDAIRYASNERAYQRL